MFPQILHSEMKNTNILYERLKNKGNIAQRALNILNHSGKKNTLGRPYSIRYVYSLAKKPGADIQVDLAIIEACEQYINELEEQKRTVKEREGSVLERMNSVLQ